MTVLGIETATPVCAVGLANKAGLVAETRIFTGNTHAEQLPVCVQNLLGQARIPAERLDGIAVSIGPGSYTGLRIGLAFAKGMAFALEKKIVAVPTMDGMVSAVPSVSPYVCVLMHSRKGEVYQGLYRRENDRWCRIGEFGVVEEKHLGDGLPKEDVLFIGEGARLYRSTIERWCRNPRFFSVLYPISSGVSIAAEGRRRLLEDQSDNPDNLVPLYLKAFQGVH
jgi:tRNA threonylcarbamoyladenosine biosynthesis protein TsaB